MTAKTRPLKWDKAINKRGGGRGDHRQTNFLFLLNGYSSPTGKSYSGGDLHAIELINYLAGKNHHVTLLLTKKAQNSCYQKMIAPPAHCHYYPAVPFEKKFYPHFPLLFFVLLYRLLITPFYFRSHQKIIATSYLFFDVLPLLFAGKRPTFVFIYHLIGLQSRTGTHDLITRFLERLSLAVLKIKRVKIIAGSPVISTQLQKLHHFPAHQILQSGNGIHLKNYHRPPPSKKIYHLLFCGRLVATKGILDFIHLAHLLSSKFKLPLKAAIIGEGPQAQSARALIKKYHLEKNCTLFGFVSENQKITLLHQSRLLILPSHEEGWSLITGEALACGTPVVAYTLPDIIPVWGENQGVTWVKPFCQDDLAAKTIRLLQDKKLYHHHVTAGYANIARYRWSRLLPKEANFILSSSTRYH